MTCPDIVLLVEGTSDQTLDLATRAHLAECADCRATQRMLALTREAYASEVPVGEVELAHMTEMVLSQLVTDAGSTDARAWDVVSFGLLGTATIGAVLVLTGAAGGLETGELWLALIGAGVATMAREMSEFWHPRSVGSAVSALGRRH